MGPLRGILDQGDQPVVLWLVSRRPKGIWTMKILLADDHTLFRSGIRLVLAELDATVDIVEAGNRDEAIAALNADSFDLVLTDLLMPGMEQGSGIADMRAASPDVPVVVISQLDNPTDIRRAVEAGASGFIPKSSTSQIMIEAIKLVLAGGVYLPPALLETSRSDGAGDEARLPGAPHRHLTDRQRAVLAELAMGKSNKEIAQSLNLSEATVKVHVAAIMRVLDVRNRTQAVLAATQYGLLPSSEPR